MESGFGSFLEILMCGIADVVFPDWGGFFLLYIFTKKRGENASSMYVKKRKEGKNNLLKSGKISRFGRSLQPKPFCVDAVVKKKQQKMQLCWV